MKVRNINDEWVVLDEGAVVSRHASKRAALLSIGYRGREIPPEPQPELVATPAFLAKKPTRKESTGKR